MKKILMFLLITICISSTLFTTQSKALNPFVTHIYTADPSAHAFENKIYVYPSHDQTDPNWFDMVDYHVFSSGDLIQWTDHGVVLDINQVPWKPVKWMWAPDCAYKNSTYYFYFPASTRTDSSERIPQANDFKIGVATSKSPAGPFIPEPDAITDSSNPQKYIFGNDPCVFVDTDGQAYMYYGGQGHGAAEYAKWVKLKSNMKEIDGTPQDITSGLNYWFEASYVFKRGNIYYFTYSTGGNAGGFSKIHYATSSSPTGPWTYRGKVIDEVKGWTNHQSFVEYPKGSDTWYAFYHSSELSNRVVNKRSICVDRLYFNSDGTMKPVVQTRTGIGTSAYQRIKAQLFSKQSGIQLENIDTSVDVGRYLCWIDNNDWVRYDEIDFGSDGKKVGGFEAGVASAHDGGVIEIREGDKKGTLLGKVAVPNTGGLQKWENVTYEISPSTVLTGKKDICLVFKCKKKSTFNLNWFRFIAAN